jgi:hypothetical protein
MRPSTLCLLFVTSAVSAQIITLPPGPFAAGQGIFVGVFNNTAGVLGVPCGTNQPMLALQHPEGAIIKYPNTTDCFTAFPVGTSLIGFIAIPASGPGSNGSFVLRSFGAAVRLDVGTPSASFSAIHTYPANPLWRFYAHVWNPVAGAVDWAFANTGSTNHVFGAADVMRVFSPGGTVPLVTTSLAGVTVPARLETVMTLSLPGLPAGPYTVETTWLDPATNVVTTQRHGIQAFSAADLNLPGGHVIPSGGVLPAELNLVSFPVPSTPLYAFCVGIAPGSTPVPGVSAVPLMLDAAVTASLADGIGGLIVNHVGATVPWGSGSEGAYTASGIGVTHPGPAFSGITVRCAAIAFEPVSGQFGASQGEDLLIQ